MMIFTVLKLRLRSYRLGKSHDDMCFLRTLLKIANFLDEDPISTHTCMMKYESYKYNCSNSMHYRNSACCMVISAVASIKFKAMEITWQHAFCPTS